ncbi:MAG: AAC(3) family N-acetyltransferase, partial [Chloroflexota bacterium]|nr:AAC(3) family N-acetyltransferase [Chloroflexota bacterium]
ALSAMGGDVLLLGVGHESNTMIHLAEQRLGRSRFYRFAKVAERVWMELPNIPGQSDGFSAVEPHLIPATRERFIGPCRVRCMTASTVLETVRRLILADPAALLCDEPACGRCRAAHQQRLQVIEAAQRNNGRHSHLP